MTRLEDYFTFADTNDIRLAGSRIGIEQVLYRYIYKARTPEEIAADFPTLTLEHIYATSLYYLKNRDEIDLYLSEWVAWSEEQRTAQDTDPAWRDLADRMRQERARRQSMTVAAPAG